MTSSFKQTIYDYLNIDNEIISLEEKIEELKKQQQEKENEYNW